MKTKSRMESVGKIVLAACGLLPLWAQAQQALERVTVTGSHVQRVAGESPSAVQVITARDIESSGASSLAEALRLLPSFSSVNVEADVVVAPERATVEFRGLDAANVLVLLNGRRLARHAVEANGQLVDLNTLPVSALDRIEVLKDGAAAVYGSDAVAGVVNFILKKNHVGRSVEAHVGGTNDGGGMQRGAGGVLGVGDLEEQGYNLLLSADYLKRSAIMRRDREVSARRGETMASSSETGNIFDLATFAPLGTIQPCHEVKLDLFGTGPFCPGYPNDTANLIPAQERAQMLGTASLRLMPGLDGFVEVLASGSRTLNQLAGTPAQFISTTASDYTTAEGNTIAAGTDVFVDTRYSDGGGRRIRPSSRTLRLVTGLERKGEGLRWSVDAGHARSRTRTAQAGIFDLGQALALGFDPLTATQADVAALMVEGEIDARTSLTFANAKVELDAIDWPGGLTGFALGASAHRETLSITPDDVAASGALSTFGLPVQTLPQQHRQVLSLFSEVSLPMQANVESQLALRADHYSDFGSVVTPKLAAKWTVVPQVALRGSYGQGFIAPDLEKLYRDGIETLPVVVDPDCVAAGGTSAECALQLPATLRANRDLKPERSRNLALGLVVSPSPQLSMQLDWYRIDKRDRIEADTILQYAIDHPDAVIGGRPASSFVQRAPDGSLLSAELPYMNLGRESTSGVEWEATFRFPRTSWGRVVLSESGRYVHHYRKSQVPDGPQVSYLGLINRPRWRHVLSLQWQAAQVELTTAWRSIGPFLDAANPGEATADTPRVGTWSTMDWQLALRDVGHKGSRLAIGMRNMFDKSPAQADRDPSPFVGHPTSQNAEGLFTYLRFSTPF